MSGLEESLLLQMRAAGIAHHFEREYRFAAHYVGLGPGIRSRLKDADLKDWRFDFSAPDLMLAVEVEGGAWIGGRHNRGPGFLEDLKKYGAAQRLGWTIYRTAGELIRSGEALRTIEQLIQATERKSA